MALERADRFLSTPGSVLASKLEESQELVRELSHLPLEKISRMTPSPSQCSLETRSSGCNLSCEKEEEVQDASPYVIRNLATGEVVDLRDECNDSFPEVFAKVTSAQARILQVREL